MIEFMRTHDVDVEAFWREFPESRDPSVAAVARALLVYVWRDFRRGKK